MSGRVTIKSIARDLGISHMTVSRALSDHPNVLKETRDAVRKRARELGYVKNAAAMAMRGDRTGIVGLLLPNIVNEFYARFANAMALACEDRSLQLIIHLTADAVANETRALERLHEVQAQGAVMVPAPGGAATEFALMPDVPVIQLIRRRDIGRPSAAILVEDRAAIRDAVAHLARQGHARIAYIGADDALSSGRARLAAFREGLALAHLAEIPELIRTGAPSAAMGKDCARDILDQGRATAMVCGGFEISNGALSALMDAGADPSGAFGFVGYGDPSFYAWIGGGVTTIGVPVEGPARRAAALLSDADRDARGHVSTFDAALIIRGAGR